MIEIMAPEGTSFESFKRIFLAGSIEMGKAEDWRKELVDYFSSEKIIFFNPYRKSWDSSWKQDPTPGTQFHTQVSWELDHIDKADLVVFYFDPKTQSPITLLELGHALGKEKNVIVCCPDGYFRKGNVVITCARHNVDVLNTKEEFFAKIKEWIQRNSKKRLI